MDSLLLPPLAPTVAVDGVDLGVFGLVVQGWDGDLAPAVVRPPTVPATGPLGERTTGAPGAPGARTLTVRGTLVAPSAVDLAAQVERLLAHCVGPSADGASVPLPLAVADRPGRVWVGALAEATAVDAPDRGAPDQALAAAADLAAAVTLVFVCADPRGRDAVPTDVALGPAPVPVPVGSAPGGAVLVLPGPFLTRTVRYAAGDGTPRATLTVTAPGSGVLQGERVELDLEAETVVHVDAAGVRRPRAAWRTSGIWFLLTPADVARGTGGARLAPTVALAAGTGTARVARAWR